MTLTFHLPQAIVTLGLFGSWVISVAHYGEKKTDSYDIVDVLIGPALVVGLLWWGGFYGGKTMNETATKAPIAEVEVQAAPTPQLPAVQQERAPRAPRQTVAKIGVKQYPARIAQSIIAVTKEIGSVQKDGENSFQHYRYPRWESINEKLSPLLAEHGLIIVQSEQSRSLLEENDKGSVLAIIYHFTIINEHGDSWPEVEWTAIARLRDGKGVTDDKAAAKCHTQAEKYFCLKQFKIVVAEENRADQNPTLPKKDAREVYTKLQAEIDGADSAVELGLWGKDPENSKRKKTLPADWQDIITTRYNEKLSELKGGPKVIWDDAEHDPQTGEV